ncbi:MAG: hypothetical protein ACLS8J_08685 [Streptococcus salivarius]
MVFKSRRSQVEFTSSFGIIANVLGGLSSAFGVVLPVLATIIWFQTNTKIFQVKDSCKLLFGLVFLLLDFSPLSLVQDHHSIVGLASSTFSRLFFGELKKLAHYFNQPGKNTLSSATLITFLAWSNWHLYFYIDGSLAVIQLFPFLVGLLTNCFILSALS